MWGATMVKQRLKAEEVAWRAAKNAEEIARDGHRVSDRARLDLEIRFIKTQQSTVAIAIMTLLGAILGIGHLLKPLYIWERSLGVIGAALVGISGIVFMWSLNIHLSKTRLEIDPEDSGAWARGAWVIDVIAFVLFAGALIVGYVLSAFPREVPVSIFE